jgi:nucleoside-diphosphate-sugar epimerase
MSSPAQTRIMAADLDLIIEHIRPLKKDLQGARIFITGGTGFIGSWLLESLAWANEKLGVGMEALVLTRNAEAYAHKAPHLAQRKDIRFHAGDVRDFAFPTGQFSHVIHAAMEADYEFDKKHPDVMLDTVVTGIWRTLDFAVQCGARSFLFASSGSVYGRNPSSARVTEDCPEAPNVFEADSASPEGKRMSELLCAIYARQHGLEAKVARIFALVGPYLPLNKHYAIGNFIRDALAGGPIKIKGDGTPYRSYLYAADLTIWLWTILIRGVSNRPYNVGSRVAVSIAELAEAVSNALPGRVAVEIAQKPAPGQPAARYVPETMRAQQELGLREWTPLDEAIRRTAQWHKNPK